VFEGNLDVDVDVALRTSHLFCPFPANIRNDRAFLDRVHAYLPGWELPRMRTEMLTPHYGFIVDYLADLWRISRGQSFANVFDRWFRLGPALDRRDDKAVRRTASGLLKLVFPHGEVEENDARWALETALEMRRRVKEQLKRMGGLEYWQTAFTYLRNSGEEVKEVTLTEARVTGLLDSGALPAGRLYAVGRDRADRRPCVFRIEAEIVPGTGRATLTGVRPKAVSDALHAAYDYVRNRLTELGIVRGETDRDLHVQVLNPMEAADPMGVGLGMFVAIVSALRETPIVEGAAIVGDMSVQGSILEPDAVGEMVLLARETGAKTLLLPEANREDAQALPRGLIEGLDLQYFETPGDLVRQVLGGGG
jgi:ATP-dependent Lon protease